MSTSFWGKMCSIQPFSRRFLKTILSISSFWGYYRRLSILDHTLHGIWTFHAVPWDYCRVYRIVENLVDIFHPRKRLVGWEHLHIGADPDQPVHPQELGQVNLWLASKFLPFSIKMVSFEQEINKKLWTQTYRTWFWWLFWFFRSFGIFGLFTFVALYLNWSLLCTLMIAKKWTEVSIVKNSISPYFGMEILSHIR